jgi:hypothetical protein
MRIILSKQLPNEKEAKELIKHYKQFDMDYIVVIPNDQKFFNDICMKKTPTVVLEPVEFKIPKNPFIIES